MRSKDLVSQLWRFTSRVTVPRPAGIVVHLVGSNTGALSFCSTLLVNALSWIGVISGPVCRGLCEGERVTNIPLARQRY
jgi:hypothetical protein